MSDPNLKMAYHQVSEILWQHIDRMEFLVATQSEAMAVVRPQSKDVFETLDEDTQARIKQGYPMEHEQAKRDLAQLLVLREQVRRVFNDLIDDLID